MFLRRPVFKTLKNGISLTSSWLWAWSLVAFSVVLLVLGSVSGVSAQETETPTPSPSPTASPTDIPTTTPLAYQVWAGTPQCPDPEIIATITPDDLLFEYRALCGFCFPTGTPDPAITATWSPMDVSTIEVGSIDVPVTVAVGTVPPVGTSTPTPDGWVSPTPGGETATPVVVSTDDGSGAGGGDVRSVVVDFDNALLPAQISGVQVNILSGAVLQGDGVDGSDYLGPGQRRLSNLDLHLSPYTGNAYVYQGGTGSLLYDAQTGVFTVYSGTALSTYWYPAVNTSIVCGSKWSTNMFYMTGYSGDGWNVNRNASQYPFDEGHEPDKMSVHIRSMDEALSRSQSGLDMYGTSDISCAMFNWHSAGGTASFYALRNSDYVELSFVLPDGAVMVSDLTLAYALGSGDNVQLDLSCYDDDVLLVTNSASLGVTLASGAWFGGASLAACPVDTTRAVLHGPDAGRLRLDDIEFSYRDAVDSTPVPAATPYGVADFTCEFPIVGDNDPVFDLTVVKKMGQTCFTIIPAFKTDNYDSGVLGFVLGVFNIDIPVVKFPGFKLCVDWYQTPGLWFFGTYISIDAIIAVIVGSWLLRRLMA